MIFEVVVAYSFIPVKSVATNGSIPTTHAIYTAQFFNFTINEADDMYSISE